MNHQLWSLIALDEARQRADETSRPNRASLDLDWEPAAFAQTRPTALDRVIAYHARGHEMHVSPIVGCYQCLHNEPRVASQGLELPAAA